MKTFLSCTLLPFGQVVALESKRRKKYGTKTQFPAPPAGGLANLKKVKPFQRVSFSNDEISPKMNVEKSKIILAFDAKRIFHNTTGLGNYGRDILRILTANKEVAQFFLFNPKTSNLKVGVDLKKATVISPKNWFWKNFSSLWRFIGQWKVATKLQLTAFHGLSGELPIALKKNNIPKIVTIHDLIFLSHPQYYNLWDRIIYRFKFNYAVHAADRVIAVSEQTKSDIIKYFNIKSDKISVIYQGCNEAFKKTYTKAQKESVREKFKLPRDFVLNVGTLQERKNAFTLVRAIHGTDYHLALVGKEKKYAKKLHYYVEKHQLKNQVTFINNIGLEELAMLYQAATVFCYPSFCEGFGIPIIEAMYSKIPVIVSNGSCFPEVAGPHSRYIDPKDPSSIRDALHWVFAHPEEQKQMVDKGYEFVQQFSDENIAKDLIAFYKTFG